MNTVTTGYVTPIEYSKLGLSNCMRYKIDFIREGRRELMLFYVITMETHRSVRWRHFLGYIDIREKLKAISNHGYS